MAKPVTTVVAPVLTEEQRREARLAELRAEAAAGSDALQAALQLLQALHDRGVLELMTALFARGDRVLHTLVELLDRPGAVNMLKNLLTLAERLGSIDPEALDRYLAGVTAGLQAAVQSAPPARPLGVFELMRQLKDPDVSAGVAAGLAFLQALGRTARSGGAGGAGAAGAGPGAGGSA